MARPDPNQLKGLLDTAHSVAVLLPRNPSFDAVAAALGLKLSLEQTGKTVVVASPDPITVEFNRLVGVDSITQNFGSRNLVISFPGQTEIVDKISYNVERGELQLVVSPKPNTPGLDYRRLKFASGGEQTDTVILVGTNNPEDLGSIYTAAREYFQKVKQYPLVDFPISEATTHLLNSLQLPISQDVASNLLSGLEKATNYFQSPAVTADTFEAGAILMRHGGRRTDSDLVAEDFPQGSIPGSDDAQAAQPQPQEDWYEPKVYRGTSLS